MTQERSQPKLRREGTQDRVEWQEVPFRNDVRRRRKAVCFDVVVWVTQVVWHKANNGQEHDQDDRQREQVLDHEVGPEWQRVFLCFFFGVRRTSTPVGLLLPVVWNAQM